MVVLLRSTDGNPDSRLQKYERFLENSGLHWHTFCWDRDDRLPDDARHTRYRRRAGYGAGTGNIRHLAGFNFWLLRKLIRHRKEYEVIHACDFDTVLPAVMAARLLGKRLVYDIFDCYTDSRHITARGLRNCILAGERLAIRQAQAVIICEEKRREQLPAVPARTWVLPNIPDLQAPEIRRSTGDRLKVAYVGVFDRHRGLEKLARCIRAFPEHRFTVAGFGALEGLFRELAESCPNLDFRGRVDYATGLNIQAGADLIYAIYEKGNPNHLYAAPNKYYEGLCLGVPVLTTRGTLVGDQVNRHGTGCAIGEDAEAMMDFFRTVSRSELSAMSARATQVWKKHYEGYVPRFLKQVYLPFITGEKP